MIHGWLDLKDKNTTYFNSVQSSYTLNKFRVKNNVLYIVLGVGAEEAINTSTETQICTIPINPDNTMTNNSNQRIWTVGIGSAGTYGGFILKYDDSQNEETNKLLVSIKPHTSNTASPPNWFSGFFAIPLGNCWSFSCRGGFTESDAETIAKTYYCTHENLTEKYFNEHYLTTIDSSDMYYSYNVVIRDSTTIQAVARYTVYANGKFKVDPKI